jgi:hypothetical protein
MTAGWALRRELEAFVSRSTIVWATHIASPQGCRRRSGYLLQVNPRSARRIQAQHNFVAPGLTNAMRALAVGGA